MSHRSAGLMFDLLSVSESTQISFSVLTHEH